MVACLPHVIASSVPASRARRIEGIGRATQRAMFGIGDRCQLERTPPTLRAERTPPQTTTGRGEAPRPVVITR
jgi:hypothetical protein